MSLLLIDDQGTQWDGASRELRAAFDSPYSGGEFADYAILNLGFVAINAYGPSWQIRMRPSVMTDAALSALKTRMAQVRVARVVLSTFDGHWTDELIATRELAVQRVEHLMLRSRTAKTGDFLVRPTSTFDHPANKAFGDLVANWPRVARQNGQHQLMEKLKCAFSDRYIVVRKEREGSSLVFHELGDGLFTRYETWRNCAVGAPVEEMPDRSYGRWIAETYSRVIACDTPVIDDIDAIVRWPHAGRTRLRYKRVLLPLEGSDGTQMLLSASLMDNRIDLRVGASH